MNHYPFACLDASDITALRKERLAALEAEMVRVFLELEETPNNPVLLSRGDDLIERMDIHRRVLGLMPVDRDSIPVAPMSVNSKEDEPAM